MIDIIDFHCHPDLYNDKFSLLKKAKEYNIGLIAMTNIPQLYKKYNNLFGDEPYIKIALGYHPQLVLEYPNEMKLFLQYIKHARFIGEVGLDKSSYSISYIDKQIEIFKEIIIECNKIGKKIISIHSRNADDIIFDFLQKGSCIYILHWYTGKVNKLLAAMSKDENIYISINLDMISTTNGRKIIELTPLSRVVLETDAPFIKRTKKVYSRDIFFETIKGIAKIKKCTLQHVIDVIIDNSKRIIEDNY